ncbi:MAG: SWIM zinc finger family protein [Parachlamydiaceae bacterium]|nr:SWIM zinc finger family protein [Parachlamydiaceae bacterium]
MGRYNNDYEWPAYVSVAERKAKAAKLVNDQKKKGKSFNPIVINGRKIATTFWGISWCENLESYSDFANRLERGRTYVRNGSVIDLQMGKGKIEAKVMGSSLYNISIEITALVASKWSNLVKICSGKIDSMIELLKGKFSKAVMEVLTEKNEGLFPKPKEIKMKCSCPDSAYMCKHIAAVLYGVGACLDNHPERLFDLRNVDHLDLIATAGAGAFANAVSIQGDVDDDELSSLFGIEMDSGNKEITTTKELALKSIKVNNPTPKKTIKPVDATAQNIKTSKITKRKKAAVKVEIEIEVEKAQAQAIVTKKLKAKTAGPVKKKPLERKLVEKNR